MIPMDRRRELVRILAEIDGVLAETEEIAEDPCDDDLDRVLELLIEFQGWKQAVEGELRQYAHALLKQGTVADMTKRLLIRATASTMVVAAVLYIIYPNRSAPLSGLIAYTLKHGHTGTIPEEAFANLQLPANEHDVPVRALSVRADRSDHAKSFCVRQRPGSPDVLLSDTFADHGRFYHCTSEGKLITASVIGGEKMTKAEINQAFAKELDFWLYWMKERNEKLTDASNSCSALTSVWPVRNARRFNWLISMALVPDLIVCLHWPPHHISTAQIMHFNV